MNYLKKLKPLILLVSVFVIAYSVILYVSAFSDAPAGTPPVCTPGYPGCDAPLNVGSAYQTKTGILQIKNPDVSSTDNADGNWFHIGGYTKTFDQAKAACVATGARLAYYSEIVDAFKNGANSCSWGWISEGFVVYPMQSGAGAGCGGAVGGVRVWFATPTTALGAYCARDSLIVNGSAISGGNLYAKGIYLNSGQTAGQIYLGLLANGSNADKLGICLAGVCKTGWDQITGFWTASGNNIYNSNTGNVGIGTAGPGAKLEVAGQIKITGGTPGANKVLTSDASGLASWQTVGGGIADNSKACNADGACETTAVLNSSGIIDNPNGYRWVGGGNWNTFYTPSGYIQIGPTNSGWAHIYSDGKPFIFNTPVYSVANTFSSYNGDLLLQRAGATILTVTASSARAPDFCTNAGKCLSSISITEIDPVWNAQKASYATQSWVTGQNYIRDGSSVNSLTVNKLYVTTIDPIYEIDGKKYATYVADFSGGVRMETAGILQIPQSKQTLINFNSLEKGSDLWLFWQASNKDISKLVIILTPSFNGKAWYEKQSNGIKIFTDQIGEVSYRLTMPRKDANEWPNLLK